MYIVVMNSISKKLVIATGATAMTYLALQQLWSMWLSDRAFELEFPHTFRFFYEWRGDFLGWKTSSFDVCAYNPDDAETEFLRWFMHEMEEHPNDLYKYDGLFIILGTCNPIIN